MRHRRACPSIDRRYWTSRADRGYLPRPAGGAGSRRASWRWLPLLLCATLTWLLLGCAPPAGQGGPARPTPPTAPSAVAGAFPLTVTDDSGRTVTIAGEPRRIVSLAPSNTEVLFALGLGERVVAVTTFCDFPEEAKGKAKVGGMTPNLEAIVAQAPDLVLGVRGTPPNVTAALEAQHVPLLILNPADFSAVLANIRMVGQVTGAVDQADHLANTMQQRWNAVAERARTAPSKPRVMFEIDASDPTSITAAGPGTFIDAMITAAGGINVVAGMTPGQQYPKLSAEAILQADPELIILGNAAFGQSLETVTRRPGWGAMGAVQRRAVVAITEPDVVSRPGPRLVDGLDLVARAIHPELFGAPAPQAS
ncbi:MAG TPA: ABC transporter substrate-binding protein [Chloroflexota bacterium]|nr:ABC transporter substrate-binding protein [Chloroflexota bacterium]